MDIHGYPRILKYSWIFFKQVPTRVPGQVADNFLLRVDTIRVQSDLLSSLAMT